MDNADPIGILLNYGFGGVVILLVITGQLRTKSEVQALQKQNEDQAEIIRMFQQQITGQTLPALTRSAQVLEAIPRSETALLEDVQRTQRAMTELVERLESALPKDPP